MYTLVIHKTDKVNKIKNTFSHFYEFITYKILLKINIKKTLQQIYKLIKVNFQYHFWEK